MLCESKSLKISVRLPKQANSRKATPQSEGQRHQDDQQRDARLVPQGPEPAPRIPRPAPAQERLNPHPPGDPDARPPALRQPLLPGTRPLKRAPTPRAAP